MWPPQEEALIATGIVEMGDSVDGTALKLRDVTLGAAINLSRLQLRRLRRLCPRLHLDGWSDVMESWIEVAAKAPSGEKLKRWRTEEACRVERSRLELLAGHVGLLMAAPFLRPVAVARSSPPLGTLPHSVGFDIAVIHTFYVTATTTEAAAMFWTEEEEAVAAAAAAETT